MELLMLLKDVQDIFSHENIIHINMLRKNESIYTKLLQVLVRLYF